MTLFELIQISPWANAIELGGVPVLNQLIAKNNLPVRPLPVIPGETWEALKTRCGTVQVQVTPRRYFGDICLTWTAQIQVQKAARLEVPQIRGYCSVEHAAVQKLLDGLALPATLKPVAEWTNQEYKLFIELFSLELVKREKAKKLSTAGVSRMVTRIKARIRSFFRQETLRGYKIRQGTPRILMDAMLIKAYHNNKKGIISDWFIYGAWYTTFIPEAPVVISKITGFSPQLLDQNNEIALK